MEIYLVRHTKVAVSREICYGISDVALADSHKSDIQQVSQKLKGIDFDHSYTSPLSRCRKLADSLVPIAEVQESLIEMSLGDWEMNKWADIDQKVLEEWMSDFVNISPPGSESFMEYSMKPVYFFEEVAKSQNHKVLMVSHSGAIRSIICHVLNLSLAHAFNFEVDYGSVSMIEITDSWYRLKFLNY